MPLVFTSDELERLAKIFLTKKPRVEFIGDNQLKVNVSQLSITLLLEEVQPRRLTFSYKMNALISFFAEKFRHLNKPGLVWEKELDRIHLYFDKMPQDDKIKDFFLRQMIIDEQKLIIDFDFYQDLE